MVRNGENAPDIYARLLLAWAQRREARSGVPVAESLRRFRVRAGGDWTRGRPENGAEGFFQPLNEGVDLDAPVRAVSITPRFAGQNPKILRKRFPAEVRQAVLAEFNSPSGVVNADTGWRVGMSGADFHEHLKFSDADAVGGLAQLEAVAALPDLMRNAKLVESYNDKKNVFQIKKMHRFQAALCMADKAYSVKLTVKEYKNGELALDTDTPLRLYHHRLEKEMPTGNSYKAPIGVTHKPSAGTPEYTLRQLLEDVKDSEGNVFFVADNALRQQKQTSFAKDKYQTPDEAFISGSEAMNKVITQQTDVLDAMFRPDVGGISFYWGTPGTGSKFKKGSGVAHLIAHRNAQGLDGEGIARKMPEVLAYGQISGRQNATGGDRIFISYDNHTAVLSLYRFGNRETWLVTGWLDNNSPDAQVKVNDSTSATNIEPTRFQSGDGAGDGQISIQPLGSDGKPLFHSAGNNSPRGSITPVDEGYLIRLYDKADLSTMLHETGHFFLLEMEQDIRAGIADASTIKDLAAIRRWLGAQGDAPLTRAQHEAFARGFERYLREGKAPSRELESIFARFRQWLVHLYRKATSLDVELNDDVRAVFNRMLAAEQNGIEFSSVKPEQSAVVSARFKSKDEFFLQRDGKAPESTLFQPMNSGVDPDLKITALPVMEETGNTWEYTKGKGRRDIINTITGILKNDYTSKEYELTRPGAEHLINSALRRGLGGLPHIAAVRNIHNLFNISIPVEIHADRKNQQDVSKMHHFFAPMLYREKAAESIYAVHILVKEYDGERRVELAGVQKLYDLQLEKKMPIEIIGARPYQTAGGRPSQQTSFQIPLRQLLEGVNDSEGVPYFPENSSF